MNTFSLDVQSTDCEVRTLVYDVFNTPLAAKWFEAFKRQSFDMLRPTQKIFQGFPVTEFEKQIFAVRLNSLIAMLNDFIEPKIEGFFDVANPTESLNRLHVHFPQHHCGNSTKHQMYTLYRYNDLIHEMESAFLKIPGKGARMYLCFENNIFFDIEGDEYFEFTPNKRFGSVYAHYCNIGRHPMEMFFANDTDIPADQIIPQARVCADSMLYFGVDQTRDPEVFAGEFNEFYNKVGVSKWPYKLNDPRMAVGHPEVARLINGAEDTHSWLMNAKLLSIHIHE